MERLLETSTLTDVTIKCENKILECHKAILSARSSVFRAMFQHDMRESKNNEIIISVSTAFFIEMELINDLIVRILTLPQ